jgi:hypothetical protein
MILPDMYRLHQSFEKNAVDYIESTVMEMIASAGLKIGRGDRIALTVGSRGIASLEQIVRAAVRALTELDARPFIIPAMGSHGGATADGQEEVLASYGITEARMGAPVISSMEVVEIPAPDLENRVFMDRHAWESDGVLLLNRVKPHTDFHGPWESGLAKMAVIGLGKHRLADEIHSFGIRGLKELIVPTARCLIDTGKIVGGIGVVENAYEEISVVEVVPAGDVIETDARLLKTARDRMPSLPVSDIDVLVVDTMGKDISGTGMDTNIIGRTSIKGEPDLESPNIGAIVVMDLSEASHGNALGVGLSDVVTRGLYDKIDFEATKANIITSSFLDRGKIPIIAETDEEAIKIALRAAGCRDPKSARICRIISTLELSDLLVSSSLKASIPESAELISGPFPLLNGNGTFPGIGENGRAG